MSYVSSSANKCGRMTVAEWNHFNDVKRLV